MFPPSRSVGALLLSAAMLGWSFAPAFGTETPPAERVLFDFENPAAVRLSPNRARGAVVRNADGGALEVVTEAGAPYPSVRLEPLDGPWNLQAFEAVAIEVRNLEDAPLRVLANVNNSGADGRNRCSTASLSLAASESGTLIVPLGKWHGEPRPFEPAAVVSLDVLLDRPDRAHRFLVDDVRAVRPERFDLARAAADPFFRTLHPPFGRGINLGNALEAPYEGAWGVTLEEDYFQAVAAAGFESVRLPVRWSAHADAAAPYAIDSKFFARVDWAVDQALGRGLAVVLNVHHYEEMDERPDEHRARLIALWRQIAERYRERSAKLAFELLNEPHDRLTAGTWNSIATEVLTEIRRSNPTRTVVVGPVGWNAIADLPSLKLPESDRNLVVTVHYYGPFAFTHQGAPWLDAKSRPPVGTTWTGTAAEQAAATRDLDAAAQWGLKHRRPIFLGEFGALNTADLESRVRWTRFVAGAAAERRMGYAYWEFCSGFGVYDSAGRRWIEPLRDALLKP